MMKYLPSMQVIAQLSKSTLVSKLILCLLLPHIVLAYDSEGDREGTLFKINREGRVHFPSGPIDFDKMAPGERGRMYELSRDSQNPELQRMANDLQQSNMNVMGLNQGKCGWLAWGCDEAEKLKEYEDAKVDAHEKLNALVGGLKDHFNDSSDYTQALREREDFSFVAGGEAVLDEEAKELEAQLPPYCGKYPSVGAESYKAHMGEISDTERDEVMFATCRENEVFEIKVGNLVDDYLQVEAFNYDKNVQLLQKDLARASMHKLLDSREQYRDLNPMILNKNGNKLTKCMMETLDTKNPDDAALLAKYLDSEKKNAPTKTTGRNRTVTLDQSKVRPLTEAELASQDQYLALNLKNALITKVLFDQNERAKNEYWAAAKPLRTEFMDCAATIPRIPGNYVKADEEVRTKCKRDEHHAALKALEEKKSAVIDKNAAVLQGLVRNNPTIFDEDNNWSLTNWNNRELIPSEMASALTNTGKAPELVQGIHEAMESNPEDPFAAANQFLASQKDMFRDVLTQAKANPKITNDLHNGIKNQFNELTDSMNNICEAQGERLHHFPDLMAQVFAEAGQSGSSEEAKAKLMQYQSAYCYLLRKDPPKAGGDFTLAQGIGIGMAVLGTIAQFAPGIGTVVGTALIIGGGALTGTDAVIKYNEQSERLARTSAMHLGGWSDYKSVLQAKDAVDDAWDDIAIEALFFAGDGVVATKLAVGAARSARPATEAAEAIPKVVNAAPATLRAIDADTAVDLIRPRNADVIQAVEEVPTLTHLSRTDDVTKAVEEAAPLAKPVVAEEAAEIVSPEVAKFVDDIEIIPPSKDIPVAREARPSSLKALTPEELAKVEDAIIIEPEVVTDVARRVPPKTAEAVEEAQTILPASDSVVARPIRPETIIAEDTPGTLRLTAQEVKPADRAAIAARTTPGTEVKPIAAGGDRLVPTRPSEVLEPIDLVGGLKTQISRSPAATSKIEFALKLAPEKPALYDDFLEALSRSPSDVQGRLISHIEKGHFNPEELAKLMDDSAQAFRRACK